MSDEDPETTPIGNADWLVDFNLKLSKKYPICDNEGCADEAVRYYRHTCCNAVSLACEFHTNAVARYLIDMQNRGSMARCTFCKAYKIPTALITRPQDLRLTP